MKIKSMQNHKLIVLKIFILILFSFSVYASEDLNALSLNKNF